GHLWQNRFFSAAMDDHYSLLTMRYVERNPLRAGICRVARRYPWSSAAAHCGGAKNELGLLDLDAWTSLSRGLEWEEELAHGLEESQSRQIRGGTHTGRPSASDRFVAKLETALGRRLRPLPHGRPAKKRRGGK